MKILYLSYDGMTDPLGQSQVIPYLKGLTQKGYEFTLVSFEKSERLHLKQEIQLILGGSQIEWIPLTYTKSPQVLSTIKDIIALTKTVKRLLKQEPYSIVHCRSYITALVGLKLKRQVGIKFIFDMRGFWADERVDGNLWNLDSPIYARIYKFFKKKELDFITKADAIISLTHNAKTEIESWNKTNTPIEVIPCCVDLNLFKSTPPTNPKMDNNIILGYLGAIGTWYMLDEMLDFFHLLLQQHPTSIFHFITKESPDKILSIAQKKGIPLRQLKIESSERADVPKKISNWSASIFFIKPLFSKKASSPTKQGEIMAMGIPIICNSGVGDTDFVIKKYKAGVLIDTFNDDTFEKVIGNFNDLVKIDKESIRNGANNFYSLENGIDKYSKLYSKLSN